jgi:hypothetical protein
MAGDKIIQFQDPKEIRRLKKELRNLNAKLLETQHEQSVCHSQYTVLKHDFDKQVERKVQDVTAILRHNLDEANLIVMRQRELMLNKQLVPIAVSIGEQYKKEAARQRESNA